MRSSCDPALGQTIVMILASTLLATMFGGALGILLFALSNDHFAGGRRGSLIAKHVADRVINMLRSFSLCHPHGARPAAFAPHRGHEPRDDRIHCPPVDRRHTVLARIVESSLSEVDSGVIDAAISCAASKRRIVFAILIPEALAVPCLRPDADDDKSARLSAMAGVIGGGGLGDLAIRYGYPAIPRRCHGSGGPSRSSFWWSSFSLRARRSQNRIRSSR